MGNTCVPKHSTHSRTCRKPAEDQVDPAFAVSGDPSRDLVRRADQMRAEPVGRRRVPGKRRVQHVAKVKKANSVVNRGGGAQSRRDVSEVDIAPQASMPTERPKPASITANILIPAAGAAVPPLKGRPALRALPKRH